MESKNEEEKENTDFTMETGDNEVEADKLKVQQLETNDSFIPNEILKSSNDHSSNRSENDEVSFESNLDKNDANGLQRNNVFTNSKEKQINNVKERLDNSLPFDGDNLLNNIESVNSSKEDSPHLMDGGEEEEGNCESSDGNHKLNNDDEATEIDVNTKRDTEDESSSLVHSENEVKNPANSRDLTDGEATVDDGELNENEDPGVTMEQREEEETNERENSNDKVLKDDETNINNEDERSSFTVKDNVVNESINIENEEECLDDNLSEKSYHRIDDQSNSETETNICIVETSETLLNNHETMSETNDDEISHVDVDKNIESSDYNMEEDSINPLSTSLIEEGLEENDITEGSMNGSNEGELDDERVSSTEDCVITPIDINTLLHKEEKKYSIVTKYKSHFCETCARPFMTQAALKSHIRMHKYKEPDSKGFRCERCNKVFSSPCGRRTHSRYCKVPTNKKTPSVDDSNVNSFQCDQCPMSWSSIKALNSHMRRHVLTKKGKQSTVKKDDDLAEKAGENKSKKEVSTETRPTTTTAKKTSKKRTMTTATKKVIKKEFASFEEDPVLPTSYSCPLCSLELASEKSLRMHHKAHHGDVPAFECLVCHRLFRLETQSRRHFTESHPTKIMEIDTKILRLNHETKTKCNLCDRSFNVKYLEIHRKYDHELKGLRTFFCDECGARFKFEEEAYSHVINLHPHSYVRQMSPQQIQNEFIKIQAQLYQFSSESSDDVIVLDSSSSTSKKKGKKRKKSQENVSKKRRK